MGVRIIRIISDLNNAYLGDFRLDNHITANFGTITDGDHSPNHQSLESFSPDLEVQVNKIFQITFGNVIKMMKPYTEMVASASIFDQTELMKGFQGLYSAAMMSKSNGEMSLENTLSQHLGAFNNSIGNVETNNRKRPPEELPQGIMMEGATSMGNFQRRNNVINNHRPNKGRMRSALESRLTKQKPVATCGFCDEKGHTQRGLACKQTCN